VGGAARAEYTASRDDEPQREDGGEGRGAGNCPRIVPASNQLRRRRGLPEEPFLLRVPPRDLKCTVSPFSKVLRLSVVQPTRPTSTITTASSSETISQPVSRRLYRGDLRGVLRDDFRCASKLRSRSRHAHLFCCTAPASRIVQRYGGRKRSPRGVGSTSFLEPSVSLSDI
jgi:hypothetical protein